MHVLAERTILGALLEGGLLQGDLAAMLEARLGAVFMPHGGPYGLRSWLEGLHWQSDCRQACRFLLPHAPCQGDAC